MSLVTTSLLIMVASSLPSGAADTAAQSGGCLTRKQAEQLWPRSHLYWHTEWHCWDVTPVGQSHPSAYVLAAQGSTERQATTAADYQVLEKDGGMVWVKPPAKVTTYYPSLLKGQKLEPEWLMPAAVLDWPLLIDIDRPSRFAPWDRRISGSTNW